MNKNDLAHYLVRLLRRFRQRPPLRRLLLNWLSDNAMHCGLDAQTAQKAMGKKKARKYACDTLLTWLDGVASAETESGAEALDRNALILQALPRLRPRQHLAANTSHLT